MKLIQYRKDGRCALGVETERGTVDASCFGTVLDVIAGGKETLETLKAYAETGETVGRVEYAPAVTGGEKILCVGLNYRAHIEETKDKEPQYPLLFSKFGNALAAHEDEILLDPAFRTYDYEAELVIVVGKTLRHATEAEAADAVFGYTCGNDLSNRETQMGRGGQWLIGKTMDGFAPVGPCIVTADALDPGDLAIRSRVNGELRQDSRTSRMIFSCARILSYASEHFTLKPGDLVFTGTPAGVMLGYAENEKKWLSPGDVVEVEIEGIGTLRNTMRG